MQMFKNFEILFFRYKITDVVEKDRRREITIGYDTYQPENKLLFKKYKIRDDFLKEANKIKKLQSSYHPCTSRFCYPSTFLYSSIVFPYYEDRDLYYTIFERNKNPLKEADYLTFILEITDALMFLEKNEIQHYDIKLENILVVRDGNKNEYHFKLTDYEFMDFEKKKIPLGTYPYIAPELILNSNIIHLPFVAFKCDIFSLGRVFCILFLDRFFESLMTRSLNHPILTLIDFMYLFDYIDETKIITQNCSSFIKNNKIFIDWLVKNCEIFATTRFFASESQSFFLENVVDPSFLS
ncbi:MAG: protein kinase family protein [Planctomycetia bacterium]|nr:protein kinase family protein [Planctomycetia bacterium]